MAVRSRKKEPVEFDRDAAHALIERHLGEYEWILEKTWVEQTIAGLKEDIDELTKLNPERRDVGALMLLNPEFVDAVALTRQVQQYRDQIEQARSALGSHFARGATGPDAQAR